MAAVITIYFAITISTNPQGEVEPLHLMATTAIEAMILWFRDWGEETGVKNNHFGNQNLKNRKLKRKRKQKRKRESLREGREAPPRRCPHPFRFCFRFRFNFGFSNFYFDTCTY